MGHSHTHDHGLTGGWQVWARDPILRVVLAGVVLAAIATIVGVVALWPNDAGQTQLNANAEQIGLNSERFSATVDQVLDQRCSYSSAADPQACRLVTFIVHDGPDAGTQVSIPEINLEFDRAVPELRVGDEVVLGYEASTDFYFFQDPDRRGSLILSLIHI